MAPLETHTEQAFEGSRSHGATGARQTEKLAPTSEVDPKTAEIDQIDCCTTGGSTSENTTVIEVQPDSPLSWEELLACFPVPSVEERLQNLFYKNPDKTFTLEDIQKTDGFSNETRKTLIDALDLMAKIGLLIIETPRQKPETYKWSSSSSTVSIGNIALPVSKDPKIKPKNFSEHFKESILELFNYNYNTKLLFPFDTVHQYFAKIRGWKISPSKTRVVLDQLDRQRKIKRWFGRTGKGYYGALEAELWSMPESEFQSRHENKPVMKIIKEVESVETTFNPEDSSDPDHILYHEKIGQGVQGLREIFQRAYEGDYSRASLNSSVVHEAMEHDASLVVIDNLQRCAQVTDLPVDSAELQETIVRIMKNLTALKITVLLLDTTCLITSPDSP